MAASFDVPVLISPHNSVLNVSMAEDEYLVNEGDGVKEVCIVMDGQATNEVIVHLSSRNITAFCEY